MSYPKRKHPRLKEYDYSQCGCYHLTICTKNKSPVLGKVIPAANQNTRSLVVLSTIGVVVDQFLRNIPVVYAGVHLDKYIIMPNHVHLLLSLDDGAGTSISTIVRSLKRMVNKELGSQIWQDSFYDVVIRNDKMYQCEWTYIDNNPDKWAEDALYVRSRDSD